jgi:hypothetical protein
MLRPRASSEHSCRSHEVTSVHVAVFFTDLAKILSDPLPAFFERLIWCRTVSTNGDKIEQRAEPSDRQRQNHGTHVKKPQRGQFNLKGPSPKLARRCQSRSRAVTFGPTAPLVLLDRAIASVRAFGCRDWFSCRQWLIQKYSSATPKQLHKNKSGSNNLNVQRQRLQIWPIKINQNAPIGLTNLADIGRRSRCKSELCSWRISQRRAGCPVEVDRRE